MDNDDIRFGHFRNMSPEDLLKVRDELESEVASYEDQLLENDISSEQRSEILNSDLPYARDQLDYVNYIVDMRGLVKNKIMH